MNEAENLLKEWESFYVITGSSAAALIGLTFVVIALTAETGRVNVRGVRTYVTPTIIHFGTVLGLAAFLSMPHPLPLALSIGFALVGAVGLGYVIYITANVARVYKDYVPVAEDWIWHSILPAAAYGTLLASAYCIWEHTQACLYAVAAVTVALMFIGIHNSWDIAVFNSLRKAGQPTEESEASGGGSHDGEKTRGRNGSRRGRRQERV